MEIQLNELLKPIELAQEVIDEKGLLDVTSNLVFLDGKLYGGNDKLIIIAPIPINLNFAVNGEDFYRAIEGSGGSVVVTLTEDNQVKIIGEKLRAQLAIWEPDDSLSWIKHGGLDRQFNWRELPKDFWEAVNWCKFSVSKDISVRALTCLCVEDNRILSTDNLRVSKYTMADPMKLSPNKAWRQVLIPKESIRPLVKFPNMTHFCLAPEGAEQPSWLLFHDPKTELTCGTRLVVGQFPTDEVETTFFGYQGHPLEMPEALREQVKRAGKFVVTTVVDETGSIALHLKDNKIYTQAVKPTGIMEQVADIKYDGDPLWVHTIPALFEQILGVTRTAFLHDKFIEFEAGSFSHALICKQGEADFEEATAQETSGVPYPGNNDIPF